MEETGGTGAYGAPLSGGGFDLRKFARQPQTIVRFFSWVSGRKTPGLIGPDPTAPTVRR